MKKLITSILALTMAVSLAACGAVKPAQPLPKEDGASIPSVETENVTAAPEATVPETTEPSVPEETKPQQKPSNNQKVDPSNFFRNDSNNAPIAGQLAVQPRYVRWENGKLVAECFVINGTDKMIYNINIKSLQFSNDDGVIATGGFGVLNNLTLAPNSYVTWTFTFSGDAVKAYGAQLGHLFTDCSWGYSS